MTYTVFNTNLFQLFITVDIYNTFIDMNLVLIHYLCCENVFLLLAILSDNHKY